MSTDENDPAAQLRRDFESFLKGEEGLNGWIAPDSRRRTDGGSAPLPCGPSLAITDLRALTEEQRRLVLIHGLHAVFRSSGGAHAGLRCEVEIKTVLRDAWSAKMHDLTHKPAGAIGLPQTGSMLITVPRTKHSDPIRKSQFAGLLTRHPVD